MAIKFSKYIRQGKKTFRFMALSGGAYGSSVAYEYGYFYGNKFSGLSYSCHKHTEIEDDPDEKDGIGGMTTVTNRSVWLGNFVNGKKHGFCVDLKKDFTIDCFYEDGNLLTAEDIVEKGDRCELDDGSTAFNLGESFLIYNGEKLTFVGQLYSEEEPFFLVLLDDNANAIGYGFFKGEELIPFEFNEWQKMPVDPVEEDGFSVLREMHYFSCGNLRYQITEGLFSGGKLNGFGTVYYDSNTNGYHTYTQKSGLFSGGELIFGFKNMFENTGGKALPNRFGYANERAIEEYGEEIIYEGKKYIGELFNGIPNGVGCLFESEEKMIKGTFKNGKPHGVGATYKFIKEKWIPYDFVNEREDNSYSYKSWGIYINGEFEPDITWEEFFERCESVKKV